MFLWGASAGTSVGKTARRGIAVTGRAHARRCIFQSGRGSERPVCQSARVLIIPNPPTLGLFRSFEFILVGISYYSLVVLVL